jgi:hypothetical protein
MCPVCLATTGLFVAGGASAGSITTYLATRWLRRRRDRHSGDRGERNGTTDTRRQEREG